jgi:hypothetical protein
MRAAMSRPVYVEILVRAPMDALWERTQDAALHARWDLRFSEIRPLPGGEGAPHRFVYATRIGLGARITGEGESVPRRDLADGSRTSSLTFRSADPRSLIREGGGYWKYLPATDGCGAVRFLTWYDYRTRGGLLGRAVDRTLFRPLLGWATAWSFDRLRLWIERGVEPEGALRRWVARTVARTTLAAVFVWHGLVPKLLAMHPDELAPLRDAGLSEAAAGALVVAAGVAEVAFGACLVLLWRRRWPAAAALAFVVPMIAAVAAVSPRYLLAAFNPLTLNLAVAALAVVDLALLHDDLPSASRCRRAPAEGGA